MSPKRIMHAAVAKPPMSACPSAPIFQNFILNAGVTASEMQRSIARFRNRLHIRLGEPTAPKIIAE